MTHRRKSYPIFPDGALPAIALDLENHEEHDVDADITDSATVVSEGHSESTEDSEAPLPVDPKCVAVTE